MRDRPESLRAVVGVLAGVGSVGDGSAWLPLEAAGAVTNRVPHCSQNLSVGTCPPQLSQITFFGFESLATVSGGAFEFDTAVAAEPGVFSMAALTVLTDWGPLLFGSLRTVGRRLS